ncbi:MAG: shikimate kinase [Caldimonas sp.]
MREPELTPGALPLSLIGLPGSGKSAVGREAARRLDVPFADCDKVVEQRAGCSIARLFERDGEPAFRELEAEALAGLIEAGASVIATGGGAVLRTGNRELLRTRSTCVFLNAPIELLWKRLKRDRRRPLLQVDNAEQRLHQLAEEREPLYRETAAIVVDVAGLSFDRIVDTVVARVTRPAGAS